MVIPSINTTINGNPVVCDVISNDFNNRTIYLIGEINGESAAMIVAQLRALDKKSKQPITMIINSPGGEVNSGFMIIDTMEACRSDIITVVSGMAASMAAIIAACGKHGMRYITPNSQIMIHQPIGGAYGQATMIDLLRNNIMKCMENIARILSNKTGQSIKKIKKDISNDYYMNADESVKYGIADIIGFHGMNEGGA